MQSLRSCRRRWLGAFYSSRAVPLAHRAQIQVFPCASAGIDASAVELMVTDMHQQDSAFRPAATAHSFCLPHRGHLLASMGVRSSVIGFQ
jgi:hypothetical protein